MPGCVWLFFCVSLSGVCVTVCGCVSVYELVLLRAPISEKKLLLLKIYNPISFHQKCSKTFNS